MMRRFLYDLTFIISPCFVMVSVRVRSMVAVSGDTLLSDHLSCDTLSPLTEQSVSQLLVTALPHYYVCYKASDWSASSSSALSLVDGDRIA